MKRIVLMNSEGWPGINRASELLLQNANGLDLVEESIKLVEQDSRVRTVGFGGAPNALGVMQLDASIMNGDTLEAASIGALESTLHPISVARKLLQRLPHVTLVGEGAKLFAKECGFKEENILSNEAKIEYEKWRKDHSTANLIDLFIPNEGQGSHGTVICLTRDCNGKLCGGISTSGWDYKYPGRLGDTPIIGAGLYVDSRYGAAACTHCGENAIRSCLAHAVVLYMKKGASVSAAVAEGIQDLSALKAGYQGQVVVYAIDSAGNHCVAKRLSHGEECSYLLFEEGMNTPDKILL